MKKIFITLATAGLLVTSAYAADGGKKITRTTEVTYALQDHFESRFSGAKDVVWTINNNCQKAAFTADGVKMTAFYSLQGDYLGVTRDATYAELADKAKQAIADKYKGYTVNQVIKYETLNEDVNFEETSYFVDLKNESNELLVRVTPSSNVYFFQDVK